MVLPIQYLSYTVDNHWAFTNIYKNLDVRMFFITSVTLPNAFFVDLFNIALFITKML